MRKKIGKRNGLTMALALLSLACLAGCGKGNGYQKPSGGTKTIQEEGLDYQVEDYVKLGEYQKLPVQYPVPEVTDSDVELYIQEQLEENTVYTEVTDRGAKEGDYINMDYVGTIDGKEFEGGSDSGVEFELGIGEFLDEFDENLIGKSAGETVTFPVTFPEEYDEELGGTTAEFTVTVNAVATAEQPEYNDDFVSQVSDCKTTKEYEKQVREELLVSAQEDAASAAKESALGLAVENAQIDGYPQKLYDLFYQDAVEGYQALAEMFGMEYEDLIAEFGEESLDGEALYRVNEYMVAQAIAEAEGITITEENYQAEAENLAVEYEYETLEEFEAYYGKVYIITQLVRERVLDFLYGMAEVEEVSQEAYYGSMEDLGEDEESEDMEELGEYEDPEDMEELGEYEDPEDMEVSGEDEEPGEHEEPEGVAEQRKQEELEGEGAKEYEEPESLKEFEEE